MAKPTADDARDLIDTPLGQRGIYRLDALGAMGDIASLPYAIKVLLEACLRNLDGYVVTEEHLKALAGYGPATAGKAEIPFMPGRVVLQDFTGVPAVVDLAAMRDGVVRMTGKADAATQINPLVPCDLVIDHSVQVDAFGSAAALTINSQHEFERNQERYQFLKWGQKAFDNFRVVPPATGIVHQVNLEYLAKVVWDGRNVAGKEDALYPDSLVGTDSHTTMINGLGVVGWGVGGIEAEAVMLGQPIYMLIPEVVGFKLTGKLPEGATATDLVLRVTELLRKHGVVGKFVEFHGPGLADMPVANRATIANMAPEYGATMGFFPVDEQTLKYMELTGRDDALIKTVEQYCKTQGLWRDDTRHAIYVDDLELDLSTIEPSLAGPRRPQDRIALSAMKRQWWDDLANTFDVDTTTLEHNPVGGWVEDGGEPEGQVGNSPNPEADHVGPGSAPMPAATATLDAPGVIPVEYAGQRFELRHGHVVIAAITSCTNTSNPEVMLGAGLVARKAHARGLTSKPWVKTSLAPGSKVVTDYLEKAELMPELEALGFHLVGYGCTTCIGNSGPLPEPISQAIQEGQIVAASVLSGNRNFEGRINPDIKANYLASPPLVVAYAIAGTVNIDLSTEPLGTDRDGKPVYLKDVWPSQAEIEQLLGEAISSEQFRKQYADVFEGSAEWQAIPTSGGALYDWDDASTYVKRPPFFEKLAPQPTPVAGITGARCLAKLGDSVTTDHISPAGSIKRDSPGGRYLIDNGVPASMFNSYGSRRGNHEVMMRGTFANVRVRNQIAPGTEGGFTTDFLDGQVKPIYDAAMHYQQQATPLVVLAGEDYGMGSSRDWAAKGTYLLGVRAVIATSFERIHRSNLVGMGVLPLQFSDGQTADSLGLDGTERFDIDAPEAIEPGQAIRVTATKGDGKEVTFDARCRIDTPVEVDYYRNGGILHTVLRRMASA